MQKDQATHNAKRYCGMEVGLVRSWLAVQEHTVLAWSNFDDGVNFYLVQLNKSFS